MKITQSFIKSLKPTGKRYVGNKDNLEWRVGAKGAIALDVRYNFAGKIQRYGVLRLGAWNEGVSDAQLKESNYFYQRCRGMIGMGYDLDKIFDELTAQDKERQEAIARAPRLKQAADAYIEYFKADKVSWRSERRYIDIIVSEIGNKDPKLIKRPELQAIIDKHRITHPTTASHLRKCMSRFWGWMSRRGFVETREQARDLDTPKMKVRDRVLSSDELRQLLGDDCPLPILATFYNPLRRAEICKLHWDNIEVFDGNHWVTVKVKGDKVFRTFLSKQFLKCVKTNEGYLFRGRHGMSNGKPLMPNSFSGMMADHKAVVGFNEKGIGLHDARTAFFSWAEGAGISERAADGVLAHSRQGVMRHYGHSDLADLKRDALNRWAKHLDSIRKG